MKCPQNYGYADGLNRITSAGETNTNGTNAGLGWSQQFAYNDAWGNRTLQAPTFSTGWSYPASFDATNRVTAGAGWTYSADYRGNLASTPEMGTMTYDAESRLQTATGPYGTAGFVYDGDGRRVVATHGGTDTVYVYDAMGQLAAEYGGPATGNGTEFLTQDHLGSTRLVTGAGGAVVERHDYAPFGEEIPAQGCGLPVGSPGRSPRCDIAGYGAASEVHLLFTGKERDGNTGLDYFGARYFSGAQGRFTSADQPLIDQFPQDPQSWNLFGYVRNNPLKFTDETGQDCIYTNNYNTNGSVTVSNEQGGCSGDGGTYVAGTVDPNSLSVNGNNGTLNYAYTPYDPNGNYTFSNLELPDPGLQALQLAGRMAEPGVSIATQGLRMFGYAVAAPAMVAAECVAGAPSCTKGNVAMALLPELGALKEGGLILKAGAATGKAAEIIQKAGGVAQAVKDFDALSGAESVNGAVRIKTFSDGSRAVLYTSTTTGKATIAIQEAGRTATKIRY